MTPVVAPAALAAPPYRPAAPAPAVPPPAPAALAPHRWTLDEYRELDKLDAFRDVKTMLLDGEIYDTPPPGPNHDLCLGLTQDWLQVAIPGHHVRVQMAFSVGTQTDPSPDLVVVTGTRRDWTGKTPATAGLVVEIADSSLAADTTRKAEQYATVGVPEYWVIDLVNRRLLIFREPVPLPEGLGATAYRSHVTLNPDDTAAPLLAPTAAVRVADLLP